MSVAAVEAQLLTLTAENLVGDVTNTLVNTVTNTATGFWKTAGTVVWNLFKDNWKPLLAAATGSTVGGSALDLAIRLFEVLKVDCVEPPGS